MSMKEVCDDIIAAFGVEVIGASADIMELRGRRGTRLTLDMADVQKIEDSLIAHPIRGTSRWTGTTYEVLLAIEVPRYAFEQLVFEDAELGLKYELGDPSRELCIGLLSAFNPSRNHDNLRRVRRGALMAIPREPDAGEDIITYAPGLFRRFCALRITSTSERQPKQFRKYLNSFMFHATYHLDLGLSAVALDSVFPPFPVRTSARREEAEIDAPRLSYDDEMVSRYIAATSSGDLVARYLGYYHVLEGQFEPLYNEYVVEQVRRTMTSPAFSMRRDSDITTLVRGVSKLVRERQNETNGIDEKRALKLTLKKYISIERLVARLGSQGFVDSIRQNEVSFSQGDRVDLAGTLDLVLDSLSNRVYKTRNAVVHAKASEENRFRPRRDSGELEGEARLMRALAEEVIIARGELLD